VSSPASSGPERFDLRLSLGDAADLVEALELIDGIDESENTDGERLRELAELIRSQVPAGRELVGTGLVAVQRACIDCGRPLDEADLRSTDPYRCDSCEQQARFGDVPLLDADSSNPLEASIARVRASEAAFRAWRERIVGELDEHRSRGKTPKAVPQSEAEWQALYEVEPNALLASWYVLTGRQAEVRS
jgi:hypothetical protein